jgi:LL-diaminopimelate aminotransferase
MNYKPSNILANLAPYPFKEIDDAVAKLKEMGHTPIDFGVGDPSDPTPDFVIESLHSAAIKHSTTGYPSYIGGNEYRKTCATYMKNNFNVSLNPETEITSSIGSKEAIFHFPMSILNKGDLVIIPSPGYPPMKTGTLFAGGIPYFVPLKKENKFLVDYESIPIEIAKKAKIIWLNYPHSPTGAIAPLSFYKGIVQWAKKYDIIIASDEGCYIDIYNKTKPHSILELERKGIIAFYSLSKRNNMTGYRVGFVCGDENLLNIFKLFKTNIDSGTPNIMQEAAIAALNNTRHCKKLSTSYFQKAKILQEALSEIGLEPSKPQATFYMWQKTPKGINDILFAKRLLSPQLGIAVTPGSLISNICFDGTNPGEGYVRFALIPSLEEVEEAAKRIQNHSKILLNNKGK